MLLFEFLRVGWTVLSIHKFRSALTLISIAIGTFSIVLMSSLAASGTTTIARALEDMGGARLVVIFPRPPRKAEKKVASSLRGLTVEDARALRGRIPRVRAVGMINPMGNREVKLGAKAPTNADLIAVDQEFLKCFAMQLVAGRPIDEDDLVAGRRITVIGHGVAKALFGSAEEALGQVVHAGDVNLRVVGVVAKLKRFGAIFFDWNDFVAAPLTAFGSHPTGQLVMMTTGAAYNDLATRIASLILRDRHNGVDDFEAFDFAVIMNKLGAVFRIMHLITGFIAGIALIAGGIGVMNILLVSVSERLREIGVRKAMGAPDRAVGLQFLFESALLSSLGGALGAALGAAAALGSGPIIRRKAEAWQAVISGGAIGAAVAASLVIGVLFGLVPARKASRMSVVDCLRAAG